MTITLILTLNQQLASHASYVLLFFFVTNTLSIRFDYWLRGTKSRIQKTINFVSNWTWISIFGKIYLFNARANSITDCAGRNRKNEKPSISFQIERIFWSSCLWFHFVHFVWIFCLWFHFVLIKFKFFSKIYWKFSINFMFFNSYRTKFHSRNKNLSENFAFQNFLLYVLRTRKKIVKRPEKENHLLMVFDVDWVDAPL